MTSTETKAYLSCAETAKLLRAALKKQFPTVKFSVRSKTYSGGASITVGYTDGPTVKAVRQVTERFNGASFDGMIDLKSYKAHFLLPDGMVVFQSHYGHCYRNEESPATLDDFPEGTRIVHFGADFVFVERDLSESVMAQLTAYVEECVGQPFEANAWVESWKKLPVCAINGSGWMSDIRYRIKSAMTVADDGTISYEPDPYR